MEGFTLDTLKVDIKGDNSGFKDSLIESQNETKKAADQLKMAMGGALDDVSIKSKSTGQQLKSVSDSAKGYGSSVSGLGSQLVSIPYQTVSSGFSAVTTAITSFGTSLISIPFTLIAASFQGMVSSFVKGIQDIEQLDLKAKRLGTDINELRVAMTWSGAAGSSVTQAIANVNKTIAQSQVGGLRQATDISSLARVSGSNVDASKFSEVVTQLSRIEDSGVRASYAFRLLGDSATDFLDVLAKPQGMQEAQKLVKRFGLETSDADLANVKAIGQTLRELQMLWEGFKNQVILAVAPFARVLAEAFDPKVINISWIKGTVQEIGKWVIYLGGFFLEASQNSELFWKGFSVGMKIVQAGFLQFKAVVLDAISEISNAINKMIEGPLKSFASGLSTAITVASKGGIGIGADIAKWFRSAPGTDLLKTLSSVGDIKTKDISFKSMADDARKESNKIVSEAVKEFKQLDKLFKETDIGRRVDELNEKVKRFADEASKGIDNLGKTERGIKNMNELFVKTMTGEFESLRRGIQLPGRNFLQDMQKLSVLQGIRNFVRDPMGGEGFYKTLLGNQPRKRGETRPDFFEGMPGLEAQIAFRSYQQLLNDVKLAAVPQLSSAAMFRTQEAVSAEIKFQMEGQRPDVQEQIRQSLEMAIKQREVQQEIGRKTIIAIDKLREELKKLNQDF